MDEQGVFQMEKWLSIYNREVRNLLTERLKLVELQENNFYYIMVIIENPGISQKVLATHLRREQSIVTKAIKPLITQGWLELVKNPEDRRETNIYPTEKALATYPSLKAILDKANDDVTAGLTESESHELKRLLRKAISHLVTQK